MCVLSLACLPCGSAIKLHSLFSPSAASRKGFPSAKRSNPQCKAALAPPSFLAWKSSSLLAPKVTRCFAPSLSSFYDQFLLSCLLGRLPCAFLSHTLLLQSADHFVFPRIHTLPIGPNYPPSSPFSDQKQQGQNRGAEASLVKTVTLTPHNCHLLSHHLLSIPASIRRSIRQQPLEISRNNISDPSNPSRLLHSGWRDPSIILSRHPLTGSVPVEELPYVNRRRTYPAHNSCQLVSFVRPLDY